MSQRSSRKII